MSSKALIHGNPEIPQEARIATPDNGDRPEIPIGDHPSEPGLVRKDSSEGLALTEERSNGCTVSDESSIIEALGSLTLRPALQTVEEPLETVPAEAVGLIYDPIMEQHVCQTGN